MPFGLLLWAIVIFLIACYTIPGYFVMLLTCGLVAFVVCAIYSSIKAHRDVKWFDETFKDVPESDDD